MLVLSRRVNEKIVFPGINATVQVVALKPGVVRLGIEAPPEVLVLREEVRDRQAEWTSPPQGNGAATGDLKLKKMIELLGNRLSINSRGLAVLDEQIEAGSIAEARRTLAEIRDEIDLLRRRLEGEVQKPLPARIAKPCHALLVEDDRNERELLASFLRLAGVQVDTAGDGSDALDYLRARNRPDVVLLDMGMPRCDGATAVREIRKNPQWAGLKIFAVSGHSPEEYDLTSGPGGIDRWFHKPLNPSDLIYDLNEELQPSRDS